MFQLILFLSISLSALAQDNLDYYIQRFRYKPVDLPAKRKDLFTLGAKIFNDKNLSGNKNISCEACHSDSQFSGDGITLALGEGSEGQGKERRQLNGAVLKRHTPALYNVGHPFFKTLFWDGRVSKNWDGSWDTPEPKINGPEPKLKVVAKTFEGVLAVQSVFPFTSPEEMLGKESKLSHEEAWDLVLTRIFQGPSAGEYKDLFKKAFPKSTSYNIGHVGNALAEFMRHHFTATKTPWDEYLRGKTTALTERMKRGGVIYHRVGCDICHNGDHLTNLSLENTGVPQLGSEDRGLLSFRFKVPPLRNVALTGPYMHSGVFQTLKEVINHYVDPSLSLQEFRWERVNQNYNRPLVLNRDPVMLKEMDESLSGMLPRLLRITEEEKDDLICFLAGGLTDQSLQGELLKKGVLNEISDCLPRSH